MRKIGILVISHGSRSSRWVEGVDEAVSAVRLPDGIPVVSSFLELVEGRLIEDGIRALESRGVTDILAIPLFISSGSTHLDEIAYALRVIPEPALPTKLVPLPIQAKVTFNSPIDNDPAIAQIMYDKIKELSTDPGKETVLLLGHGTAERGFHRKWRHTLRGLADRMKELGHFAAADYAMLLPDQLSCRLRSLQKRRPGDSVIVAVLFLSEGYFTKTLIPSRLDGVDCRYNGRTLLPDPQISRWIERQVELYLNAAPSDHIKETTGDYNHGKTGKTDL